MMIPNNDLTRDDLRCGGFTLLQPKKGYRFAIDAPILAALVSLRPALRVLDMGCGGGVLPLLLLGREPSLAVCGIELRHRPFDLAVRNMSENGVDAELILGDAMEAAKLLEGRRFDLIVSNPPYYPADGCRLPLDGDIAAAKVEVCWDLDIMMEQVFALLADDGRFAVIYDGARKEEIRAAAKRRGFYLRRFFEFFPQEGAKKSRVYLEWSKEKGECPDTDTLVMYDNDGEMTPKMKRILKVYDGTGTVPCGDAHR